MGNCCSSSIEEDENEPLLHKGRKPKDGASLNSETIIPELSNEDEPSVDIVTISAATEKEDPNQEMVDRVISKFVGVDDADDYDYDNPMLNNSEVCLFTFSAEENILRIVLIANFLTFIILRYFVIPSSHAFFQFG